MDLSIINGSWLVDCTPTPMCAGTDSKPENCLPLPPPRCRGRGCRRGRGLARAWENVKLFSGILVLKNDMLKMAKFGF